MTFLETDPPPRIRLARRLWSLSAAVGPAVALLALLGLIAPVRATAAVPQDAVISASLGMRAHQTGERGTPAVTDEANVPNDVAPGSDRAGDAVAAPQASVGSTVATVVRTVDLSLLDPPVPDPTGIAYVFGFLRVVDSEVEETPLFVGSNTFELSRTGVLQSTGSTIAYSKEPTGAGFNPANGHLFVSDDDKDEVFEIDPGPDGSHFTPDDVVTSFDTAGFGSADPEGVEFDPVCGCLYIVDGAAAMLFRIDPGPDGSFGGSDDEITTIDLGAMGAKDPEGLGLDANLGVLLVADHASETIFEITRNGALFRTVDISAVDAIKIAGVTMAPGTSGAGVDNVFLVARGVDNSEFPDENDGSLIEISVPPPPMPPGGTFTDDNGSVHEPSIEAIAAAGITFGCNPPVSDRFCPNQAVTRAQMAAFLRRALGLATTGSDFFVDDQGSIFEDDINAIAAAGITIGCNPPANDRYCPDDPMTRAQMASMLRRAFSYPDAGKDYFNDDGQSVHESAINAIADQQVTFGCNPPENTQYCPADPVTRAQMASFLTRALDLTPIVPPPA